MNLIKRFAFLLLLLMATPGICGGGANKDPRIENSVIGWWSSQPYDNQIKPSSDPTYKARVAVDDRFVDWMRKTYDPVAGLGTIRRQNTKLYFGVYFMVWNVGYDKEWLDAKGNFTPISEEGTPFGIQGNAIPGSYAIEYFNHVSEAHYFTWPVDGMSNYEVKHNPRQPALKAAPASAGFITRSNEHQSVFLAPDNKLPFTEVSIGEYLDMADKAFANELKRRKDRIDSQWPSSSAADAQSRAEAFAYVVDEYSSYKTTIAAYRDKYKNRLAEPAVLRNMQPSLIGDFSEGLDPFEIDEHQRQRRDIFPVYKLTEDTIARCKSATPQWIAVWYPYARKESGNQWFELYRSMTEHLNYPYIYNYFFDPAKVAGQDYHPLEETALRERQARYGRIESKK